MEYLIEMPPNKGPHSPKEKPEWQIPDDLAYGYRPFNGECWPTTKPTEGANINNVYRRLENLNYYHRECKCEFNIVEV